jgi:DNA segregation ATPase FtsK/SpoIIIE, S-DNA-T family
MIDGAFDSEAEGDRPLAVSLLQRLDRELIRRGDIYRKLGIRDATEYPDRGAAAQLPSMLLVVEDLRELFNADDRLSQEASLLLDRLVRQGQRFGVGVKLDD